jgi:ADYC domain-containing protein
MRRAFLTVLPITQFAACTLADGPSLGSSEQYGESLNGESLNGESLNGESLNGESLNGESLNGPNTGVFTIWTSLDGVTLNGLSLSSTSLDASVFSGTYGGTTFTGTDMIGATFHAMRGNGHDVLLRVSSVRLPVAPATAWFYYVDYLEDDGEWYPACKKQGEILASVPINGVWDHHWGEPGGGAHLTDDPTKFTFACEKTGAIAKCVVDGYEPWSTFNGVQLAHHHEACVRLLRADYCGDGTSYTKNGRLINLYDGIGVQLDTDDWGFEAEWTPDGAPCVTSHHRATVDIPCYDPALEQTCGQLDHFNSGTLLMNELP